MKLKSILEVIASLIGIVGFIYGGITYVDNKINRVVYDDAFIKQVADKVRPIYIIFDGDKRILFDSGSSDYIQDLTIQKDKYSGINQITLIPKKYIGTYPLLTCISGNLTFDTEIERGEKYNIVYSLKGHSSSLGTKIFKLEILK